MKIDPGYPLPEGELGEDEIVCQLVYLPDRPEYWQAFLGALSYMTTWKAWERDDDKRGKDAAANWRDAFELTIGCWRMTCLEQLQADVAAILALMQTSDPCCGDNVTYGPSDDYDTDIDPGVGDPPEYYGEEAVEDWDEWLEYLCFTSNAWVDTLIFNTLTAAAGVESGGISVALLAGILAAISFVIPGGVIAIGFLMLAVAGLVATVTNLMLEDAADDIEAAREDIVCAILQGGNLAAAVEDAVGSGTVWDLFYTLIDYDSAVAVLYEGGNGETYLEAETSSDCDCDYVGAHQITYPFLDDEEGWIMSGVDAKQVDYTGDPPGCLRISYNGAYAFNRSQWFTADVGEGITEVDEYMDIHRIRITYAMDHANFTSGLIKITADGGDVEHIITNTIDPPFIVESNNYDPPLRLYFQGYIMFIKNVATAGSLLVDNVYIDFDIGQDP